MNKFSPPHESKLCSGMEARGQNWKWVTAGHMWVLRQGERSAFKRMGQSQTTTETGSLIRWLVNSIELQTYCYCSNSWVNFSWAQQASQLLPTTLMELSNVIPRVLLTLLPQGKIAHTLPVYQILCQTKLIFVLVLGAFPEHSNTQ